MSHDRVVDTALIYEGSDKKFSTPSLKDVVKAALGKDIQDGSHDSITDAQVFVVGIASATMCLAALFACLVEVGVAWSGVEYVTRCPSPYLSIVF